MLSNSHPLAIYVYWGSMVFKVWPKDSNFAVYSVESVKHVQMHTRFRMKGVQFISPWKGMMNFHWLLWYIKGQIKHSIITTNINSNLGLVLQAEISVINLTQAQQLLPSKLSSTQFLNRSSYFQSSKIPFSHYYRKK